MVKFTLGLVMLLVAVPLQAQTARDSLIANKIRFAKDSAHCTTAAQYRDRCNRAKIVLDSIMASLRCGRAIVRDTLSITFPWKCSQSSSGTIDTIEIFQGPITGLYYTSGVDFWPNNGVDSVTVCPLVTYPDGSRKVGWPLMRMRLWRPAPNAATDSVTLFSRGAGASPLSVTCGGMGLASFDSVTVAWKLDWLTDYTGTRLLRPFAWVP